jgi:hypothetical protein
MDALRRTIRRLPLGLLALFVVFPAGLASGAGLPGDVPTFTAIYSPPPVRPDFLLSGYVAQFTPQGPIAGTIQPVRVPYGHVTIDPRGPTYYAGYAAHSGQPAVVLNPATGATTSLTVDDPEMVSWPTGLAFDTTRNRLVTSTLGGVGYLYTYTPEEDRWTTLRSLENKDIHSLTYSAADDALYALEEMYSTGGTSILRYTLEGRLSGTLKLDPALPSGIDPWKAQLVATGDKLVLLTQPLADPLDPRIPAAQRSYLIDTRTGSVTALGAVRVVPEPAAAVLVAALGATALQRRRSRP